MKIAKFIGMLIFVMNLGLIAYGWANASVLSSLGLLFATTGLLIFVAVDGPKVEPRHSEQQHGQRAA